MLFENESDLFDEKKEYSVSVRKNEKNEPVYYLCLKRIRDLEEEKKRLEAELETLFRPHLILN